MLVVFFTFPLPSLPLFLPFLSVCFPLNKHFQTSTMYVLCARRWDKADKDPHLGTVVSRHGNNGSTVQERLLK